jgi:hypothetical protein
MAMNLSASQTSVLSDISRRTTNYVFLKICRHLALFAKPLRLLHTRKLRLTNHISALARFAANAVAAH